MQKRIGILASACSLIVAWLWAQPVQACGLGPENVCMDHIIVYGTRPPMMSSPYISSPFSPTFGMRPWLGALNLSITPPDPSALAAARRAAERERQACIDRINNVREQCVGVYGGSTGQALCAAGSMTGGGLAARGARRVLGYDVPFSGPLGAIGILFYSCADLEALAVQACHDTADRKIAQQCN